MRLSADDALGRLTTHLHGVLSTLHPTRGVDAVPVVYALADNNGGNFSRRVGAHGAGYLGVPVDLVKPKSSTRLRREDNLEADPRASLLIDHWDADHWDQLWWVRAELRFIPSPADALLRELTAGLMTRYRQYAQAPFARILAFEVVNLSGWAAH